MKTSLFSVICALMMAFSMNAVAQDGVTDTLSIDDQPPVLYQEEVEPETEEKSMNVGVYVAIAVAVAVGVGVAMKGKKKK